MKVFITGRSGFVGVALDHYLRQFPEVEIRGFNRRDGGDIRDFNSVLAAAYGSDLIINLAALSHVDYSWIKPFDYYQTNGIGAVNVMEVAKLLGIPLIHISTSEVYGTNQNPGQPMSETHPIKPHYPYSEAKAMADFAAQNRIAVGQKIVVLRPFNQYGSGSFQTVEKLIPKLVKQAVAGQDITVYGDGQSTRDWVFVADTAEAIWLAKDLKPGVYNICTGKNYSALQVAELVRDLVGLGVKIKLVPFPPVRPNEVREHLGDNTKFYEATGWKPKVSLEEGIKRSIAFYTSFTPVEPSFKPKEVI